MEDKQELLKHCLFYTGEEWKADKFAEDFMAFFFCEVEENFIRDHGTEREKANIEFYVNSGLKDTIPENVLPLSLAASLFGMCWHCGGDNSPVDRINYFKSRFLPEYLKRLEYAKRKFN